MEGDVHVQAATGAPMSTQSYNALMEALRSHVEDVTGRTGAVLIDFVAVTSFLDPEEEAVGCGVVTVSSESYDYSLNGLLDHGREDVGDGMHFIGAGWATETEGDDDDDDDADA